MKRIPHILFFALFTFHIAGYFLWFKIQQYEIREQVKIKIKNTIPENKLTILHFHPSSAEYAAITWVGIHEFQYKGEMFDVVRQSTGSDGTMHYYCLKDNEEKILFAALNHWAEKNTNQHSNPASKNILELFSLIYFSSNQPVINSVNNYLLSNSAYAHRYHYSPLLEIVPPPPKPACPAGREA